MENIPCAGLSAIAVPCGVEWALHVAGRGWRVFPIRPGTKEPFSREATATALGIDPATLAGVHHARSDEPSIRALWADDRADAFIGLAMGNGWLAIDCDEKNGKSGLATMAANGWILPATASQRTPSGGAHFILAVPPGITAPTDQGNANGRGLGDGLDRRGDGGYIILYDSEMFSVPIAPAPAWSLANASRSGETRSPLGTDQAPSFDLASKALWSVDPNELTYEQWRNVTAAYRQSATGTADDKAIRTNWEGWCATYGKNDGAANNKLWRSLANGTGLGWAFLRDHAMRHGDLSDDDRARLIGFNGTVHQLPAVATAMHMIGADNFFVRASDMEYRPPEYHITDLIETDALAVLFGDPATGKSFIAIDMACCVATGNDFHGHEAKQGPVFYIAGEGRNGIRRRLTAWENRQETSLTDAPLYVSRASAQFLDGNSAIMVASAIDALTVRHGIPRLIVVDTLARNFGAGDENSQKDMTTFIVAMDGLRLRFPGCTIIIVHHSGHGDKDRARGSSVLKGAVDAEYKATKADDRIKLENQKMKDGPPPRPMEFRLESVGYSAALAYLGEPAAPSSNELTRDQQAAWDAFNECGGDIVATAQWRDRFYAKHQGTDDAKRKAFQRARDHLARSNLVAPGDDGANYRRASMPGMMPPRGDG